MIADPAAELPSVGSRLRVYHETEQTWLAVRVVATTTSPEGHIFHTLKYERDGTQKDTNLRKDQFVVVRATFYSVHVRIPISTSKIISCTLAKRYRAQIIRDLLRAASGKGAEISRSEMQTASYCQNRAMLESIRLLVVR
jgi:hypothetical protein